MFGKKKTIDESLKKRLVKRLGKVNNTEVIRWCDTVLVGMGKSVSEIRKSLDRDTDQALAYIEDTRNGAIAVLAALDVLEERSTRS